MRGLAANAGECLALRNGSRAGKYIVVIAPGGCFEHGLYIRVSGAYLQIYDGEYPGFINNIEINFCPKCGRMLREVENNADSSI